MKRKRNNLLLLRCLVFEIRLAPMSETMLLTELDLGLDLDLVLVVVPVQYYLAQCYSGCWLNNWTGI